MSEVSAAVSGLVDHHCHAVVSSELSQSGFERLMTEGTMPTGVSVWDTPLGLAIRRWCAPEIDLPSLCEPQEYLERRRELGAAEASARLLTAAGLSALLVDTGITPAGGTGLAELSSMAAAPAHEIVRIESVFESVLTHLESPGRVSEQLEEALWSRTAAAVGLKTVLAYRGGLEVPPSPSPRQVQRAAARVAQRAGERADREPGHTAGGSSLRLEDRLLLRHGLDVAAGVARERGLPVQVHCGMGDPSLDLHRADPTLLTPLLRELGARGVTIALLHCYPYHRQAGYLAAVFPHVYFDVGLALPYLGPASTRLLSEALELAPFAKQLYSSDAYGLPEISAVAARAFRHDMDGILARWVDSGACTSPDAARIYAGVAGGNARRIYPLPDSSAP